MAKIFITRPIPGRAREMLEEAGHEVSVNPENKAKSPEDLKKVLSEGGFDGALSLLEDKLDASLFDAAPNVKIYANYAVGFNNADIEEANKRGVTITNTPCDEVNESVAEHTFAMILALSSRVVEGDRYVRAGKYSGWDPNLLIGMDLKGKTLGVIGAGRIGSFVIEKAVLGFGMNVIYYDVIRNETVEKKFGAEFSGSVDEALKRSDMVTLHVFLDDSTRHLIDARRLDLMKSGSYLVNTSRGPVVDEVALTEALKSGKIKGAALDVFEKEPMLAEGLTELSNVVLTPHIASSTELTRGKMSEIAAKNLIDFFAGREPECKVNVKAC